MGKESAHSADGTPTPLHGHAAATASKTSEQIPYEAAAMSAEEKEREAEEKEREARVQAYLDELRITARERMTVFAERGEAKKKCGRQPDIPPFEMLEFPDLLERAWGWDWLVPCLSPNQWSKYKKYLEKYYEHNIRNGEDGDGIAELAVLCVEMEHELVNMLKRSPKKFSDAISQSHMITKCANEISKMNCCEFPAAAIALKCMMEEANLMCQSLISDRRSSIYGSILSICGRIRKYALSFMTYKAPAHIVASATMMAATKGASFIIDLIKDEGYYSDDEEQDEKYFSGVVLRDFALETMMHISNECSAAEGGSNVSNLVFGESNDNGYSENELVQNYLQETEKTNQQKCSKEDRVKESNMDNIDDPEIEEHVGLLTQDNLTNLHQSEVDVSKPQVLVKIPTDEEHNETSLSP